MKEELSVQEMNEPKACFNCGRVFKEDDKKFGLYGEVVCEWCYSDYEYQMLGNNFGGNQSR